MFSRETIGQFGTCQTRFFHGPGVNAFNHTQFSNPSGSVTSANFGKVTSARSPRIAQMALKFLF